MNTKILLGAGAIATSLVISLPTFAHGEWYMGAGVNLDSQTNARIENGSGNTPFEETDYDLATTDLGFDVYAGYNVNQWYSIETGFTYVGDATFKDKTAGSNQKLEVEDWRIYMAAVGRLGITENFKAIGRAGVAYYDIDQQHKDAVTTATDSTTGFAMMYGVGLEAGFGQFAARLDYTGLIPQDNTEHDDIYFADLIGLSFMYWYG